VGSVVALKDEYDDWYAAQVMMVRAGAGRLGGGAAARGASASGEWQ
jgi:hypothetical protein